MGVSIAACSGLSNTGRGPYDLFSFGLTTYRLTVQDKTTQCSSMSETEANRQIIATVFEGLRVGEPSALMALLAEDMVWDIRGSSSWSRRVEGRDAVLEQIAG